MVAFVAALCSLIYLYISKGGKTKIYAELTEYQPIDKLFTSFAYVPLLDLKKGTLKRQLTVFVDGGKSKVVKGYCARYYDVGVGYNNTTELIKKYQNIACQEKDDQLPEPEILSLNATSSSCSGDYSRIECDSWDKGDRKRASKDYVLTKLKHDKQWDIIAENSKKILGSFIRIYCTEEKNISG